MVIESDSDNYSEEFYSDEFEENNSSDEDRDNLNKNNALNE
jgi:hypothetical protein